MVTKHKTLYNTLCLRQIRFFKLITIGNLHFCGNLCDYGVFAVSRKYTELVTGVKSIVTQCEKWKNGSQIFATARLK